MSKLFNNLHFFCLILSCLVSTKRSHIFKETCSWKVNTDWAVMSKKIITTDSYFFFLVNISNGIISFIRGSLREITTLILSIHLTKNYSRGNLYHAVIVYFQFFILCKTQRNREYFMVSILPCSLHTREQINEIKSCIRKYSILHSDQTFLPAQID